LPRFNVFCELVDEIVNSGIIQVLQPFGIVEDSIESLCHVAGASAGDTRSTCYLLLHCFDGPEVAAPAASWGEESRLREEVRDCTPRAQNQVAGVSAIFTVAVAKAVGSLLLAGFSLRWTAEFCPPKHIHG
jgi:hypothetical protein